MDVRKTAREIGLFETALNLAQVSGSTEVAEKAGALMPLPETDIDERTDRIVKWLLGFGKKKYFFLTPEIALIERIAELDGEEAEAIIAVPCDMEAEARERLRNNLPRGIAVTVLEEPYFPSAFFPGNGIIVVCGYSGGGRAMILPDTYRMAEHYSGFLGKKVFVPYAELSSASRYDGWMELGRQRIDKRWESES